MNNVENKNHIDKFPTRASKNHRFVATTDRKQVISKIMANLLFGEITQGEALKMLRIRVLGLNQDLYAKLINVSRKTLSEIENDRGNYSADIINKVFKPFGLKVGLVPSSPHVLSLLLKERLPINE
ncbi:helix-turn-helix transcriptional regulator [Proteus terrae]|uniref:helix-turn-helix transcriptional regulator n=1 Tax=Proteus terrae TaxID=1574161 RepID=UPI003525BDCB